MLVNFNPAIQNRNFNTKKMDKTSFGEIRSLTQKQVMRASMDSDFAEKLRTCLAKGETISKDLFEKLLKEAKEAKGPEYGILSDTKIDYASQII